LQEYRRIANLDNQFEVQILEEVLKDRQIPYYVKSYHDAAYDGLFQGQKGWGAVFAPEEFQEEILAIIQEIRESK
jgi:hypothetical protein